MSNLFSKRGYWIFPPLISSGLIPYPLWCHPDGSRYPIKILDTGVRRYDELMLCCLRRGYLLFAIFFIVCGEVTAAHVHPGLAAQITRQGSADILVVLPTQTRPSLAPLATDAHYLVRRKALVDALRERAEIEQAPIRAWLTARGIDYRSYWIANVIATHMSAKDLSDLAQRKEISRMEPDLPIPVQLPSTEQFTNATATVTWGVDKINAPDVWAVGTTGQGVIIAGQDTGYQWDHSALKSQYRGWDGSSADHNYNWHDAIHASIGNPCGNDATAPCDDGSHGTHTMGTMVGDDGVNNQIGVAPGAKWIGCRNMDEGVGTPSTYIECMEWLLAPTDLNGLNPNSDLAPDVINNSWSCPPFEGCTAGTELETAVDNLVAAGIFYAAAAQNSGSGCGTSSIRRLFMTALSWSARRIATMHSPAFPVVGRCLETP